MAGTTIPAVMVGGINSDMPDVVIGQVAENVCQGDRPPRSAARAHPSR
jgi:type IV secretory pathway VirB10-like protein